MTIDDIKQARHGDRLVRRVMNWQVKRLADGRAGAAQAVPDLLHCIVMRPWADGQIRVMNADGTIEVLGEHDLPDLSFARRVMGANGRWMPEHFYGENV